MCHRSAENTISLNMCPLRLALPGQWQCAVSVPSAGLCVSSQSAAVGGSDSQRNSETQSGTQS